MRRLLFIGVVIVGLAAAACEPNPVPPDALAKWEAEFTNVTPLPTPPPIVHSLLNTAIRRGIPVVCPVLASQAEPDFQAFITGTCNAIQKSNDPYTALVKVLPALCAGDPPVGSLAYPKLAPAIEAGCPLLLQLAPLLDIFSAPPS
jgi:hypothetical protein